jgi:bifunctional enzyme Fae/Hps
MGGARIFSNFFTVPEFLENFFCFKNICKTIFTLVGIGAAGGVRVSVVRDALKAGADILVVARAIMASKDIKRAAEGFIVRMDKEEIDQFRVMTDF